MPYVSLKIGGLNSVNTDISKRICRTLEDRLGIPADRVYINFIDIPDKKLLFRRFPVRGRSR